MPTLSPSVAQALHHLRALVDFAYAQGFHELGYDPVKDVTNECERAQSMAGCVDPVALQACLSSLASGVTPGRTDQWRAWNDIHRDGIIQGFDSAKAQMLQTLTQAPRGQPSALQALPNALDAGVPIGSVWTHSGGDVYVVEGHTNLHSTQPDRYPPSIVYRGPDGRIWSRPVADWSRSMIPNNPKAFS